MQETEICSDLVTMKLLSKEALTSTFPWRKEPSLYDELESVAYYPSSSGTGNAGSLKLVIKRLGHRGVGLF